MHRYSDTGFIKILAPVGALDAMALAVAGGLHLPGGDALHHTTLPIAGLSLLLGVDWFTAICRVLTNMIGNSVARIVVVKFENAMDAEHLEAVLKGKQPWMFCVA